MYSSYYWTRYTEGLGMLFMYSSYCWTRYTEGCCLCILLTAGLDILKDVVYVFFLLLD